MTPEALVFDLDGTLVDSRRDIAAATNATLREHGRAELQEQAIESMIGDGSRALVARAFGFSKSDARVDAPFATFLRLYEAHPCVHTTLLPGAREVLAMGLPCALVTNKTRAITLAVLDALGIAHAFGAVRGGDEGPLKPDPSGVLAVCNALGVAPARAWMIGDGPQDIEAGRSAGCVTVAVKGIAEWSRVESARPDRVVASLSDLVSRLKSDV